MPHPLPFADVKVTNKDELRTLSFRLKATDETFRVIVSDEDHVTLKGFNTYGNIDSRLDFPMEVWQRIVAHVQGETDVQAA